MNLYNELIEKFLKQLNDGMEYPVRTEEGMIWKRTEYSSTLKFLCTGPVPRMVFLAKYKTLPPIETLTQEEKTEWKKFVNGAFPGTTPQFRLEAVKIIYTIAVLTS